MKLLYCTNKDVKDLIIPEYFKKIGCEVFICQSKFDLNFAKQKKIEFIITDRSRFLITKDIIDHYPKKIINLHNSYLPWCRGYNSIFWSVFLSLPLGVTIHEIDEGIDSGNIICQKLIKYNDDDTLESIYIKSRNEIINLLINNWKKIKNTEYNEINQKKINVKVDCNHLNFSREQEYYSHKIFFKRDFINILPTLPNGYSTKVSELRILREKKVVKIPNFD